MSGKLFFLFVIFLALDRGLKIVLLKGLIPMMSFFGIAYPKLTLHTNPGIAFNIQVPQGLIIVVSFIIIAVLLVWMLSVWRRHLPSASALLLVVLGAGSNLYDRIVYGHVIDTIEVFPGSIWNIADFMIAVGLLILIFRISMAGKRPVDSIGRKGS